MRPEPDAEIGYVLKGFPRLSETFIANEIHLLETMGLKLHLFSVKRGDEKTHGVVGRIRAPLMYLPEVPSVSGCALLMWLYQNLHKFTADHRALLRRRPGSYCKTLLAAVGMSWKYRYAFWKLRKSIIKEFLQAGSIARQVLEAERIRHLHGHFCHGATTITWFASRLSGIPFSFTAHAKDIYQHKLNPGDLLQRKLEATRFVATCTAANYEHLKALYPQCRVVHTIYHGLDTDYFTPVPASEEAASVPLMLSVGRFVEKKGFDILVEACARLDAGGVRFQCMIVGEKGDQLERIRSMVETHGLVGRVSLCSAVTQEKLREIYERATLFVLPCRVVGDGDRDGIPNVLVESMAMGLPVVSTSVSGIPELVKDSVNGLLVPQCDSDALAMALRRLLEQPELRRRFRAAGRETVCTSFDARKTTLVLKELFLSQLRTERVAA